MSVLFASASSQYIANAASPITAVPFTVGLWWRVTTAGVNRALWSIADTGAGSHYWALLAGTGDALLFRCAAGGADADANAGTISANRWYFSVCRAISTTNRRQALLDSATGAIVHAVSITSRTPANVDTIAVGARVDNAADAFIDGSVAEFWYCDVDIQADGAQLQDWMLQQLAYYGPFSVPHLAASIVEYRSFRSRLGSDQDAPREVYCRGTRPTWTAVNGPIIDAHPPLAGGYFRPQMPQMPTVIL